MTYRKLMYLTAQHRGLPKYLQRGSWYTEGWRDYEDGLESKAKQSLYVIGYEDAKVLVEAFRAMNMSVVPHDN